MAGDSAGGNLLLVTTLKCLQMGIRIPDGMFLAYTPTWLTIAPTPSRLLCLMDPLIPLGFIMRCLKGNFFVEFMKSNNIFSLNQLTLHLVVIGRMD